MKVNARIASYVVMAVALSASGAALANHGSANATLGTPVHEPAERAIVASTGRTIVIDAATKKLNVYDREIVKFVVPTSTGQESFLWRFDTRTRPLTVELNQIAPAGLLRDRDPIRVTVWQNPLDGN